MAHDPHSTACVERGFSFMTKMAAMTRLRRMKEPSSRAEFIANFNREWLENELGKRV